MSIDLESNPERQWMEVMYREAGPRLLSYLAQRLGDVDGAEDILQETFVVALRYPDRLRSAYSARAYLFGIARNLASKARRRASVESEALCPNLAREDLQPDPRLELLRERIAELKPEFREVLELRLQFELSYEEIAQALSVPVGTVRSRLHYAVNQLRRTISKGDTMAPA